MRLLNAIANIAFLLVTAVVLYQVFKNMGTVTSLCVGAAIGFARVAWDELT